MTREGGVKENEQVGLGRARAPTELLHKDLTTPPKAGDRRLTKSIKEKKNEGPQRGQSAEVVINAARLSRGTPQMILNVHQVRHRG